MFLSKLYRFPAIIIAGNLKLLVWVDRTSWRKHCSSCSGLFRNHDGQDSSGEPASLRMGVRVPRESVQEQPLLHGCPKRGVLRCCSRCGLQ